MRLSKLIAVRVLVVSAGLIFAGAALADPPAEKPIEVMIVGDFHMSNPGHDIHNLQTPDVLTSGRQAEIAAIDDGLARFRPTVVVAEWPASVVAERYPKYLAGTLAPSTNEVVQLGFRLSKMTGARMIGPDVDGDFPYEAVVAYAKAHGQQALLDEANAGTQRSVEAEARILAGPEGLAALLRYLNDPINVREGNAFYADLLKIGGGADQPGAAVVTAWNQRNFLICANLIQAARPGDRMVVFYGAGHGFLLRRCVAETPGFKLVESGPWLARRP